MTIKFSRELIKGRIAEVVFEQMIRDEGKYTVIPFGYEHTMPTLAQYRHLTTISKIMDNISDAPDFALISENKTEVYLVEVKFRTEFNLEEIKKCANDLLKRWEYSWIFVATPKDFYCSMCKWIIRDNNINKLSEEWISKDRQSEYLKLLNEFEK